MRGVAIQMLLLIICEAACCGEDVEGVGENERERNELHGGELCRETSDQQQLD